MKRTVPVLSGLFGLAFFCSAASAQSYTLEEKPGYSEAEIRAAFATCMAQAEKVAETKRQFPMFIFSEPTEPPFAERLENCVVEVLEKDLPGIMPLD